MKLNRDATIELLRKQIINLKMLNTNPQFETHSNHELIKACYLYFILLDKIYLNVYYICFNLDKKYLI